MMLSILSGYNVQIPVTPLLIFVLLAFLLAGWLLFTIIIRYHWKNYGTGGSEIFTMNFHYLTGSGVLIAGLLATSLLYLLSSV